MLKIFKIKTIIKLLILNSALFFAYNSKCALASNLFEKFNERFKQQELNLTFVQDHKLVRKICNNLIEIVTQKDMIHNNLPYYIKFIKSDTNANINMNEILNSSFENNIFLMIYGIFACQIETVRQFHEIIIKQLDTDKSKFVTRFKKSDLFKKLMNQYLEANKESLSTNSSEIEKKVILKFKEIFKSMLSNLNRSYYQIRSLFASTIPKMLNTNPDAETKYSEQFESIQIPFDEQVNFLEGCVIATLIIKSFSKTYDLFDDDIKNILEFNTCNLDILALYNGILLTALLKKFTLYSITDNQQQFRFTDFFEIYFKQIIRIYNHLTEDENNNLKPNNMFQDNNNIFQVDNSLKPNNIFKKPTKPKENLKAMISFCPIYKGTVANLPNNMSIYYEHFNQYAQQGIIPFINLIQELFFQKTTPTYFDIDIINNFTNTTLNKFKMAYCKLIKFFYENTLKYVVNSSQNFNIGHITQKTTYNKINNFFYYWIEYIFSNIKNNSLVISDSIQTKAFMSFQNFIYKIIHYKPDKLLHTEDYSILNEIKSRFATSNDNELKTIIQYIYNFATLMLIKNLFKALSLRNLISLKPVIPPNKTNLNFINLNYEFINIFNKFDNIVIYNFLLDPDVKTQKEDDKIINQNLQTFKQFDEHIFKLVDSSLSKLNNCKDISELRTIFYQIILKYVSMIKQIVKNDEQLPAFYKFIKKHIY